MAYSSAEPLSRPFLVQVPESVMAKLEEERRLRGYRSRGETIRALLLEGLRRAEVRRGKGQPVEVQS